jgi:acyl-CoA synthetase (AMP-forming)/AMP-acid ligase II
VQEALPDLTCEMAIVVSPGDLLGFKGSIVNFVSRYVKRNVKRYKLPATIRFPNYMFFAKHGKFTPVEVGPDDPAFLQYTGGTTGRSKGAVLLHRNIIANVNQCEAWLRSFAGERADDWPAARFAINESASPKGRATRPSTPTAASTPAGPWPLPPAPTLPAQRPPARLPRT